MYKYFGVATAGLLIMFVLSGGVANSFGLSEKEPIEIIAAFCVLTLSRWRDN